MAIDIANSRSRRTVLAGALGGIGAWLATAIGRTSPVRAGVDGDVILGTSNAAGSTTSISTGGGTIAFLGLTTGNGVGVYGQTNGGGSGVFGYTPGGGRAIYGVGYGDAPGVVGSTSTAPGAPSSIPLKTGVFGWAIQDSASRGVHGQSTAGRGVYGQATSGFGVRGYATTGTALYGATSGPKNGVALRTVGKVRFDNSVGIATIAAGTKSKTVTPGINLTSTSAVVATLQGSAGGTTTVHRVVVDAAADTFRIYLTANATKKVKVAWHVFG